VDGAAHTFNNLQKRTAITSVGSQLHKPAQTTVFDNASETIAIGADTFFGIPTWGGDNATLTITDHATVYIQGPPVDSTNVTATNDYALFVDAGSSRFDGQVFIGDSSNDSSTVGLTINMGAEDDNIITLKSSDVSHKYPASEEVDTFARIKKQHPNGGGIVITSYADDGASSGMVVELQSFGEVDADTSASTGAYSHIMMDAHKLDGTSEEENHVANELIFGVQCRKGNSTRAIFFVDEDGDTFQDGSAGTAYDAHDDAALIRGIELARSDMHPEKVKLLPSRYDSNRYDLETIEDHRFLGKSVTPEQKLLGHRPLVNSSAIQRLTNGAIWQNHEMLDALMEALDTALTDLGQTENFQTTYVRPKFVERGLPTQIIDWDGPITGVK
jgi:hypothetical protein